MAMQSWVNREYSRGLSTHPCGAPVLRVSVAEVMMPTLTTWGQPVSQEVRDPVAEGGVQSQGPKLGDELGGDNGVER